MPVWDTARICTPVPTLPWVGKGHTMFSGPVLEAPGWAGWREAGRHTHRGREQTGEVHLPAVACGADHGSLHALHHQRPLCVQLVLG